MTSQQKFTDYIKQGDLDETIVKNYLNDHSEINLNLIEGLKLSPMHYLLNNSSLNLPILEIILKRGGNVNLPARFGETPMDLLECSKNKNKVTLINHIRKSLPNNLQAQVA